ncbi:MAG: hypothetical protein WBL62_06860 [Gallionella sp.]
MKPEDALIAAWTNRMTMLLRDGATETDPAGKEAMRFGAMCIGRCIEDAKRDLPEPVQGVSISRSKHQKSWLPPFLLRLRMLFSIARYLLLHQGNHIRPK